MSRLKKLAVTTMAAAAAAAGTLALTPGAAHAASLFTVRLAPDSNPFLFVEVQGASTNTFAPVDQWSYNGGGNQVWTFVPTNGQYEIVNQHSGKCLWTDGKAGDQLLQVPCAGSIYDLWSIDQQWIDGNFAYSHGISNLYSGLFIDVKGGSGAQGAAIIGWSRNYSANQRYAALPA